ncbi:hypothetical protein ES703_39943 [subsurface metagenome]
MGLTYEKRRLTTNPLAPLSTRYWSFSSRSSSSSGLIISPRELTLSLTPTVISLEMIGSGLTIRARFLISLKVSWSDHDAPLPMGTISSKPSVVINASLGPVLWSRVFIAMVVEYLTISVLPSNSLTDILSKAAASLIACIKPTESLYPVVGVLVKTVLPS